MFATNYEHCKKFLERSLSPMPTLPEYLGQPYWKDSALSILNDKGQLREGVCCTNHKYYEWELDREYLYPPQRRILTSQVFRIEKQLFSLEVSTVCRYEFRVRRLGPPVEDAIYAWSAGLIFDMESNHSPPTYRGGVDLSQELTKWVCYHQLFTFSSSFLHNVCFYLSKKVKFFFRIEIIPLHLLEKSLPIVGDPCYYGSSRTTPISVGSIEEKDWKMCKKVQWDIPSKSLKDNSGDGEVSLGELLSPMMVYKSPVFEISDQTFYISLEFHRFSKTKAHVYLHRKGPSVDMTVRWWIVVKNGSDRLFASRNLDWTRPCVEWRREDSLISIEKISESSLSVEFLISKVDMVCGVIKSLSGGESPLELDPSRTEFLSFRVMGGDMTVHRSLLVMRVPVFEAMLSHDTLESRTGVLSLDEDSDLGSVALFLHYVDTGNGPLWGDRHQQLLVYITANLCKLADKYLLEELRDMCLALFDRILDSEEEEAAHRRTIAWKLSGELAGILSNIPDETLQKWPRVHDIYTNGSDAPLPDEGEG